MNLVQNFNFKSITIDHEQRVVLELKQVWL